MRAKSELTRLLYFDKIKTDFMKQLSKVLLLSQKKKKKKKNNNK